MRRSLRQLPQERALRESGDGPLLTKGAWAAGDVVFDIELAPTRYEAWVRTKFAGLPDKLQKLAFEKWMRIREWHLAERRVWKALSDWSTRRTQIGQQNALDWLRKMYSARNEALHEAEKAHFALSHITNDKQVRRSCSQETYDLLIRHPGWYPPRHRP